MTLSATPMGLQTCPVYKHFYKQFGAKEHAGTINMRGYKHAGLKQAVFGIRQEPSRKKRSPRSQNSQNEWSRTRKNTKGDDAAPVASSPSAFYCCFVCHFSQSCVVWRSPRSPNHRVTS